MSRNGKIELEGKSIMGKFVMNVTWWMHFWYERILFEWKKFTVQKKSIEEFSLEINFKMRFLESNFKRN